MKKTQVEPFVIFITKIELFGLNERVIEEARCKVKKKKKKKKVYMHWNNGFCKESKCNYGYTNEDCFINLQG